MKGSEVDTDGTDDPSTIDATSRAAHLWLTRLFEMGEESGDVDERHAIAGGFICGLCKELRLKARTPAIVAYVYALLNQEGARAVAVSRSMLESQAHSTRKCGFARGVQRARQLVKQLR